MNPQQEFCQTLQYLDDLIAASSILRCEEHLFYKVAIRLGEIWESAHTKENNNISNANKFSNSDFIRNSHRHLNHYQNAIKCSADEAVFPILLQPASMTKSQHSSNILSLRIIMFISKFWKRYEVHRVQPHTVCTRAVSVALHTPQLGGQRCHRGPKIPVPSPLCTPEKASIPQIEIWSTRNQWS